MSVYMNVYVSVGGQEGISEDVFDSPVHSHSPSEPSASHQPHPSLWSLQCIPGHWKKKGVRRKAVSRTPQQAPWAPQAHSPAHRDGKIEDTEHPASLVSHKEVSDEGGGDGGVTGLPDPHQAPGHEQQPEPLRNETGTWWCLPCDSLPPPTAGK